MLVPVFTFFKGKNQKQSNLLVPILFYAHFEMKELDSVTKTR